VKCDRNNLTTLKSEHYCGSHFMNLQLVSQSPPDFTLHILLEQQPNGHTWANVPALPNCAVERSTREEALEAIQRLISERLTSVEVLPIHISPTPHSASPTPQSWQPFLGMFKDDPYFAAIADELWAKRQSEDDEEISIDWTEPTP
jgi:predicted RNase H-like HicB family nuclease